MQGRSRIRKLAGIVAVAGAVVLAGFGAASVGASTVNPNDVITLQSVPASAVTALGLSLERPTTQPSISQAEAQARQLDRGPYRIAEAVVARVVAPQNASVNGCTCWVLSLTGENPVSDTTGRPLRLIADLVFIDAQTGMVSGRATVGQLEVTTYRRNARRQ